MFAKKCIKKYTSFNKYLNEVNRIPINELSELFFECYVLPLILTYVF